MDTNDQIDDGDSEGVESESISALIGLFPEIIDRPFDPLQIRISRRVVPINLIVKRIEENEVELAPDFQRRARIWDVPRKSKLIESLVLRIPLPVFYVAADAEENWRVVDGLQRLTTIYDFVKFQTEHSFSLRGLEYLSAYEGATFDELPRSIKRRIEETELNINVIESGTPDEVMFNIFKRINTGGITLNGQEIRHALNPGYARKFLLDLSNYDSFLAATDYSIRDHRMSARELVLRFCAFYLNHYLDYAESDLDGFLNKAMKQLNSLDLDQKKQLEQVFDDAMFRAYAIFGDDAFRKRFSIEDARSPVNRALFESWSVALAKLNHEQFEHLELNKFNLRLKFLDRMNYDEGFLSSISVATGSKSKVYKRFSTIEEIISECLN